MINRRLEHKAVLWKGRSPLTENHIVIRYDKLSSENQCLCPKEAIDTAKMLGFPILPHWTKKYADRGYKSIKNAYVEVYDDEDERKSIRIDPFVQAVTDKEVNNAKLTHILRKEGV